MKYLEIIIERHIKIINWTGVILGSWILSMIVSELIGTFLPAPTFSSSVSAIENPLERLSQVHSKDIAYYIPICERNIFDSEKRSPCVKSAPTTPFEQAEPRVDPNAAPVRSSIGAVLKGTTVFGDPSKSFAIIAEGGKTETERLCGKAGVPVRPPPG